MAPPTNMTAWISSCEVGSGGGEGQTVSEVGSGGGEGQTVIQ